MVHIANYRHLVLGVSVIKRLSLYKFVPEGRDFVSVVRIREAVRMERFDCSFFSRSEWISRDDDVTMVFALDEIAAAILIFSGNALRYVNCGCLTSAVQSCTKISVEFRHTVEFLFKGFNFCVNWILDLIQATLLLAGCSWEFFPTHSLLCSTLGERNT